MSRPACARALSMRPGWPTTWQPQPTDRGPAGVVQGVGALLALAAVAGALLDRRGLRAADPA